ncbi:MAG TPA: flagellar basal body rod protein FlgB [Aeromonadales bacterium]|nr:flagellar basal body rod protein FlgB [Aeromonadales bacterium]
MAISIDKVLGFHPAALLLREKRTTLLASNIANGDTPGYKAKDIDFRRALDSIMNSGASEQSMSAQMQDLVQYRVPLQPDTGDGNSVDMQQEKMAFAQNSLDYQLSLSIIDGRIKGMMKALRGE